MSVNRYGRSLNDIV